MTAAAAKKRQMRRVGSIPTSATAGGGDRLDSVDGTFLAFGPDKNEKRLMFWLQAKGSAHAGACPMICEVMAYGPLRFGRCPECHMALLTSKAASSNARAASHQVEPCNCATAASVGAA